MNTTKQFLEVAGWAVLRPLFDPAIDAFIVAYLAYRLLC